MAHADYSARGLGLPFCPTARLAAPLSALETTAVMTGYTSPIAEGIRIGMAAMIGSEIVVVEGRSGNTLTLGRGTCDTIPAPHAPNTPIFFFDDSVGTDDRQYVATESIGVKPLPRTNSGGPVAIESSPPVGLTFNWRFHRPYPPGNVRINGEPFTALAEIGPLTGNLTLTWAHRNRIVQMDQLVKHGEPSIAPEVGTTYRVRVIRASDNSVRRTVDLTASDTSWTYTFANMLADFGPSSTEIPAIITLESRRDGLSSWQSYRMNLRVLASILSGFNTLNVGYEVTTPAQRDSLYGFVTHLYTFDNGETVSGPFINSIAGGPSATRAGGVVAQLPTANLVDGSGRAIRAQAPAPGDGLQLNIAKSTNDQRLPWCIDAHIRRLADVVSEGDWQNGGLLRFTNFAFFVRGTGSDGGAGPAGTAWQARFTVNGVQQARGTRVLQVGQKWHIALSWSPVGTTQGRWRCFIDGTLEFDVTLTGNNMIGQQTSVSVGPTSSTTSVGTLPFELDFWRLTIGDARYTAPFTPPAFAANYLPPV